MTNPTHSSSSPSSAKHPSTAGLKHARRSSPRSRVLSFEDIIDKGRRTKAADAQIAYEAARLRREDEMTKGKERRVRADQSALRMAAESNILIEDHFKQILVEMRKNVRAQLELQLIGEVRDEVHKRYAEIADDYKSEIKAATYVFLVDALEPVVKAELREQMEEQVRSELREELKAEVKAQLYAEYEAEGRLPPVVNSIEGVVDPNAAPNHAQTDNEDVNVGREGAKQFADQNDNRYANETSSQAGSTGSKRSRTPEDDEEDGSPAKRQRSMTPEEGGASEGKWSDKSGLFVSDGDSDGDSDSEFSFHFQDEADYDVPPPLFTESYQVSSGAAPLIREMNSADQPWVLDDDDDEGVKEKKEGNGALLESAFPTSTRDPAPGWRGPSSAEEEEYYEEDGEGEDEDEEVDYDGV